MAFYKDFEHKTRQQKKDDAYRRGGWDDEGSGYRGKSGKDGYEARGSKSYGKPAYGSKGGKSGYEARGERDFGGNKPYGKPARDFGGKPSFGPKGGKGGYEARGERSFGESKPYGKPSRDFGGKSSFGPKGGKGGYEARGERSFGESKPYGKPSRDFGGKPSFGPKGGFESREERGFGGSKPYGKPARDFERKPSFGPKGGHEARGERSFGGSKPYGKPAPREDRPRYEDFRYEPAPAPVPEEIPAHYDNELDAVPAENLLSGRNPIREALKSGRDIEKLLVARGELSGSAREILAMAKERRVPVQEVDRARLDAITPNHQGMLAFASAYAYSTLDKMLALAEERGEEPFLILLDGITDPHNLGAVIRSAECAGAHGVIVQERRAVGLTPAAVKASAGAVEYLPVARVTNLGNTIEELKSRNIWVYAADMSGEDYAVTDLSGGVALVIGAEGEGVGRRVLDLCDKTISLPIRGHVDSLNASVAAGILMYAVVQARR